MENIVIRLLCVEYPYADSRSLLDNQSLKKGSQITVEPWGVIIAEE
ncbi:hypothetical protein [uncultured Bacteroides sp.]|nr:hypothetical protein [uncultured Bacteroides sp.]